MTEKEISYKTIGAAIELHKQPGPVLFESAYESALAYESNSMGLFVEQ
jgi:hypothetical protein